jgi:hypothetical protein
LCDLLPRIRRRTPFESVIAICTTSSWAFGFEKLVFRQSVVRHSTGGGKVWCNGINQDGNIRRRWDLHPHVLFAYEIEALKKSVVNPASPVHWGDATQQQSCLRESRRFHMVPSRPA